MRPAAVIFDLDGVILDSESPVLECWDAAAEACGIAVPDDFRELCMSVIGSNPARTRAVFLERFGEDFPYDRLAETKTAVFRQRFGGGRVPLKPGVRELLTFLAEQGIPAAVASSTPTEIVRKELEAAGLLRLFRAVAGGDQVSRSKPAPDIFLHACARLETVPERALVIEDSYNGVRAAFAGGIPVIMVPDLLPPTEEMREKAAAVLGSLEEVRAWIERM